MRIAIDVEIKNLKVDQRFFSFDYVVWVDGSGVAEDGYESDYENGNTPEQQRDELLNGEAVRLTMQRVYG